MTIRVQSTVEINEIERELTFEFEYTPAERGSCDYYGQQMEPDAEENMRFYAAYDENGEEVEVPSEDVDAASEFAFEEVYGCYQNDACDDY